MQPSTDLLQGAVSRRLQAYTRDIFLHSALGTCAISAGAGLFVFLWRNYRADETELIAQLAGGSTTLITAGLGGFLVTKVLSVRDQIREGQEWLQLYKDALGPPPNALLDEIKHKILDWLEG